MAQKLVDCGLTMLPTRVVYEAIRDIVRAESLPHEEYFGDFEHTDGVVIENAKLMQAVADMVAKSKAGVEPSVVEKPFVP